MRELKERWLAAAVGGDGDRSGAWRRIRRLFMRFVSGFLVDDEDSLVDLGTFTAPAEVPLAPIERVVEEGVLIATSAVRMAVKNRLLVRALRDDRDYDHDALMRIARGQFVVLARENDQAGVRLALDREIEAEERAAEGARRPRRYLGGRPMVDRPEQVRGPTVYRLVADALRQTAADDAALSAVVSGARDDAWDELGHEVGVRLRSLGQGDEKTQGSAFEPRRAATQGGTAISVGPDYERERAGRLRALVEEDLAELARTSASGARLIGHIGPEQR